MALTRQRLELKTEERYETGCEHVGLEQAGA